MLILSLCIQMIECNTDKDVLLTMSMITILIGGYIATSLILFKFPQLIHRKKKLHFYCRHISHRGGAGENLENTITAYKHAVHQGTDMLEIDLQLTKDGEVVVSHDDNLYRSTGVNMHISELDYKDLPSLKKALPIDFAGGDFCIGGEDTKIPLLKDVFEHFQTIPINIDIKTDNDLLIKKVNQLIKQYNRETITVWGNFSKVIVEKCYKENPNIPLFFSAKQVILLILFTYLGLLPFIPLKESCLELLLPGVAFRNPNYGSRSTHKKKTVVWILWLMDKLLMRKALFQHLEKRGIQTYLWVLNDDDDFEKAFKLGVAGVMTDYPTKLKEYLEKSRT